MKSLRNTVVLTGLVMATAATAVVALPAQAQELNAGNVIGGIAGALIGSNVGGGSGRVAATAAGGIIGAIVGGNVERNNAYAYSQGYAPQQAYGYAQPAPQYQPGYATTTYAQPVYQQPAYVEPAYATSYAPVYTQPSYAYVQPSTTIVYAQSGYRGREVYRGYEHRDYRDYRDPRGQWQDNGHRDHERHDR